MPQPPKTAIADVHESDAAESGTAAPGARDEWSHFEDGCAEGGWAEQLQELPTIADVFTTTGYTREGVDGILQAVLNDQRKELSKWTLRQEEILMQVVEQQENVSSQLAALQEIITASSMQSVLLQKPVNGDISMEVMEGDSGALKLLEELGEEPEEDGPERDETTETQASSGSRKLHKLSLLGRIVTGDIFDGLCMALVLVNSVYMGYNSEHRASYAEAHPGQGPESQGTFNADRIIEVFFFSGYCLEFFLKLLYWRLEFFRGREAKWNIFDGALLVLNGFDLLEIGGMNMMALRIAKLLTKLTKALRMVRVVRFCRELRLILLALTHSMSTFLWTCLVILLMMYVSSIIFVQGVADYLETAPETEHTSGQKAMILYWGSIGTAMLTNYKAITGGGPWGDAGDALREAGFIYFMMWLLYIGLLTLAVLRLLTGIFTQHAKAAFDQDQEDTVEMKMRELFERIDDDGSGQITQEEFRSHMNSAGAARFMSTLNLHPGDLIKLMHLIDSGDDGMVDINEFITGCRKVKGFAKNIDMIVLGERVQDITAHLGMAGDSLRSKLNDANVPVHGALTKRPEVASIVGSPTSARR